MQTRAVIILAVLGACESTLSQCNLKQRSLVHPSRGLHFRVTSQSLYTLLKGYTFGGSGHCADDFTYILNDYFRVGLVVWL